LFGQIPKHILTQLVHHAMLINLLSEILCYEKQYYLAHWQLLLLEPNAVSVVILVVPRLSLPTEIATQVVEMGMQNREFRARLYHSGTP
jgi:hypothetical protein